MHQLRIPVLDPDPNASDSNFWTLTPVSLHVIDNNNTHRSWQTCSFHGSEASTPELAWLAVANHLLEGMGGPLIPELYGYYDLVSGQSFPMGPHTWYIHEHRPGIPLEEVFDHVLSTDDRGAVLSQQALFVRILQLPNLSRITNITQAGPGRVGVDTSRGPRTLVGSTDYRTMIIEKFEQALRRAETHTFTRDTLKEGLELLHDDYKTDPTVRSVSESEQRQVLVHNELSGSSPSVHISGTKVMRYRYLTNNYLRFSFNLALDNMVYDPRTKRISLRESDDVCVAHAWHQLMILPALSAILTQRWTLSAYRRSGNLLPIEKDM